MNQEKVLVKSFSVNGRRIFYYEPLAYSKKGKFSIRCNGCPEIGDSIGDELPEETLARLKSLGWVAFRVGVKCQYRCPLCAEVE